MSVRYPRVRRVDTIRPILCPHPDDKRVTYPPPTGTVCTLCGAPAIPVRRGLEDE